jgi:hypothetical protein
MRIQLATAVLEPLRYDGAESSSLRCAMFGWLLPGMRHCSIRHVRPAPMGRFGPDLVNGTKTATTATDKSIMPTAEVSTYSVGRIVAEDVFLSCVSTSSRRTRCRNHDVCRGGTYRSRHCLPSFWEQRVEALGIDRIEPRTALNATGSFCAGGTFSRATFAMRLGQLPC